MTDHDKPMLKDPDPDGNHTPEHVTDGGPCWCGPTVEYVPAADSVAPVDHLITDVTSYSEDTMFKVQAAITGLGYSGQPVLDLIGAMQNAGILFREHGPEYTTNDQWVGLKNTEYHVNVNGGEPVEIGENTMAAEPIELRLQRAWLNGFKEGVERSSYAAIEATGRWDY